MKNLCIIVCICFFSIFSVYAEDSKQFEPDAIYRLCLKNPDTGDDVLMAYSPSYLDLLRYLYSSKVYFDYLFVFVSVPSAESFTDLDLSIKDACKLLSMGRSYKDLTVLGFTKNDFARMQLNPVSFSDADYPVGSVALEKIQALVYLLKVRDSFSGHDPSSLLSRAITEDGLETYYYAFRMTSTMVNFCSHGDFTRKVIPPCWE